MVSLSRRLRLAIKLDRAGQLSIDYLRLSVRGGTGGQGNQRITGIGGDGGNVVLRASSLVSLSDVNKRLKHKRKIVADKGGAAGRLIAVGQKARDTVIPVPTGITVKTDDPNEILGELNKDGDSLLVAKGGEGASPATNFKAQRGQQQFIRLDLKLIADVGLVGFPNAGKSTFLRAISRAKPKVAAYPFTTLRPHLGVIDFPDFRRITIADLPGLVEGASENVGLGFRFLKHIERTKLLLFIVDVTGFQLHPQAVHRHAWQTVLLLNKELEAYDEALISKPAVICLNKLDLPNGYKLADELEEKILDYQACSQSEPDELRPRLPLTFVSCHRIITNQPDTVRPMGSVLRQALDRHYDQTWGSNKVKYAKSRELFVDNRTIEGQEKLIKER